MCPKKRKQGREYEDQQLGEQDAVGAADTRTLLGRGEDTAAGVDLTNLRGLVLPRVVDSAIVGHLLPSGKLMRS